MRTNQVLQLAAKSLTTSVCGSYLGKWPVALLASEVTKPSLPWSRWMVDRSQKTRSNGDQVESRHLNRRRILHRFFELGILIKGVDGGLELFGGLLLLLLAPATINGILLFFVRGELKEDPTDLVANLLLRTTGKVVQAPLSASAFLIVHGVVKLLLVAGLAANKLWSYPTALAVFAGFTSYQVFQLWHQSSLLLGTVTVLDMVVILLVFGEFRHVRIARSPRVVKTR